MPGLKWRRERDSNPRYLASYLILNQIKLDFIQINPYGLPNYCLKFVESLSDSVTCAESRRAMSKPLSVYPYRDKSQPNTKWKVDGTAPDGRRVRRFFKTKIEAEAFALDRNREVQAVGALAMTLADDQRVEAAKCYELLSETGKSLTDAVQFYLKHLAETERSVLVKESIAEFLEEKGRLGLSGRHMSNLRYQFRPLVEKFGSRKLAAISRKEMDAWLTGRRLIPTSFKCAHTHLSMLFNHAVKAGYVSKNIMHDIAVPKAKSSPPGILTPLGARRLIELCRELHPDILPAILIQAFAGLRTQEVLRLNWKEVRMDRKYIEVTSENSKTAQRRLVPISPNLLEFLVAVRKEAGPVAPSCYHSCAASLRVALAKAGYDFPRNALRHSFASYHLALHHDAAKTALEIGHNTTDILFRHYRELVTPEDARDWFVIRLESASVRNILSLANVG